MQQSISSQPIKLVLVVDDNADARDMVVMVLERAGIPTESADSAKSALDLYSLSAASGHPYRVIITDVAMPEGSGFTLCELIRDTGDIETRLILLTGHAFVAENMLSTKVGISDIIRKPCAPEALVAKIKEALGE